MTNENKFPTRRIVNGVLLLLVIATSLAAPSFPSQDSWLGIKEITLGRVQFSNVYVDSFELRRHTATGYPVVLHLKNGRFTLFQDSQTRSHPLLSGKIQRATLAGTFTKDSDEKNITSIAIESHGMTVELTDVTVGVPLYVDGGTAQWKKASITVVNRSSLLLSQVIAGTDTTSGNDVFELQVRGIYVSGASVALGKVGSALRIPLTSLGSMYFALSPQTPSLSLERGRFHASEISIENPASQTISVGQHDVKSRKLKISDLNVVHRGSSISVQASMLEAGDIDSVSYSAYPEIAVRAVKRVAVSSVSGAGSNDTSGIRVSIDADTALISIRGAPLELSDVLSNRRSEEALVPTNFDPIPYIKASALRKVLTELARAEDNSPDAPTELLLWINHGVITRSEVISTLSGDGTTMSSGVVLRFLSETYTDDIPYRAAAELSRDLLDSVVVPTRNVEEKVSQVSTLSPDLAVPIAWNSSSVRYVDFLNSSEGRFRSSRKDFIITVEREQDPRADGLVHSRLFVNGVYIELRRKTLNT